MIEANLIISHQAQGEWQTLGKQSFVALPRVGEIIDRFDEHEVNSCYEILSVHHLVESEVVAVDIYARKLGSKLDVLLTHS